MPTTHGTMVASGENATSHQAERQTNRRRRALEKHGENARGKQREAGIIQRHRENVPQVSVHRHHAGRLPDLVQPKKQQAQGEQALANAAINFAVQELESDHAQDEKIPGRVGYAGCEQLHGDGHANAAAEQDGEHFLGIEPAGVQHLQREDGQGRGRWRDRPCRDAGPERLPPVPCHRIQPRREAGAEEPVESLAKKANAEDDQREAFKEVQEHRRGDLSGVWILREFYHAILADKQPIADVPGPERRQVFPFAATGGGAPMGGSVAAFDGM
ncbi:MAG: hypothetical protein WDO13_17840 [Verrucomicrobiota bacterium]